MTTQAGRFRRRWSCGGVTAALLGIAYLVAAPAGLVRAEEPGAPPAGSSAPPPAPQPQPPEPAQTQPQYPVPAAVAPNDYSSPYATPPSPPKVAMVHERRKGLVVAGGIAFGVSWGLALFASLTIGTSTCSQACKNASHVLWIPVAGPVLAERRDPSTEPAFTTFWTLLEGSGLVLLTVGLIGHDVSTHELYPGGPMVTLAPTASRSAGGLQLSATF